MEIADVDFVVAVVNELVQPSVAAFETVGAVTTVVVEVVGEMTFSIHNNFILLHF